MAQLSHKLDILSDGTVRDVSTAPPQLYRIRHDFEVGYARPCVATMGGCPEVWFLRENQFNWLTREWQEYWFWLNRGDRTVAGDLKAWSAYTNGHAFITDYNGTDDFHDYITNDNEGKPYPDVDPKIKRLVCGGNVVTGTEFEFRGAKYLSPVFMDASQLPDYSITYKTHPWLVHHAVNVTSANKANPFAYANTKYGGRNNGAYILYPFMGVGEDARISMGLLEKLPLGASIPNPYYPPMEFVA